MTTFKLPNPVTQGRAATASRQLARLFLGTVAIAFSLCLGAGEAFASGELPVIRSETAAQITETSAYADVCVSADGSDTNVVFSYGPTLEYGTEVDSPSGTISGEQNTAECVGAPLTGLQPGTLYYFEAQATNSAGTVTSANATFRTTPGVLPVTESISGGTAADMIFTSGPAAYTYLQPAGLSTPNSYSEYTTWPGETEIGPTVSQTETLSDFTFAETNSSPSDQIVARLLVNGVGDGPTCAVDGSGSCSSNTSETITVHPGDHLLVLVQDIGEGFVPGPTGTDTVSATFGYHVDNLISPELVEVSTGTASPTETEVTAEVAPEGTDTLYHIEYGPVAPGELSAPIEDLEAGDSLARPALPSLSTPATEAEAGQRRRVTQTLAGLTAGQTYHYRVIATNAGGTTTSPEWTFQADGASTHPRAPSLPGGPPGEKESERGPGAGNEGAGSAGNPIHLSPIAIDGAAQVMALLRELVPSSVGAAVAELLKHGTLTLPLRAPAAGKAVLDWYDVPGGGKLARRSKSKSLLVASGHAMFSAAGRGGLKLKLTEAGKRLLEHAKQVTLTAKAVFIQNRRAPVAQTTELTVKR